MMQQTVGSIQIVGENSLLNALLAAFLKDSLEAECRYFATLEDASRSKSMETDKQLILIDCFAMSRADILSMFESPCMRKVAGRRPTLFNLHADRSIEQSAIECGIRGFFYLDDPVTSLAKGITALFEDEYWISRKLLVDFLATPNHVVNFATHHPELTLRESELIGLLTQGLSNQAIADLLFISIPTVKSHLSSIYRKIKVNNRLQAVCWAEKATTNLASPPQV
jgi:LuxR family transcriptional regulator, positive regulator of biofilm formation